MPQLSQFPPTLKQKDSIVEAPRHLFSQIELTRLLPKDIQAIARKNIARNAYWAHPEVLLLAMLADQKESIHSKAVDWTRSCVSVETQTMETAGLACMKYQCSSLMPGPTQR